MIRLIRGLLALAAAIVVVLFAVSNRAITDVGVWPMPQTIELPVYGVFLLGLVGGALLGGVIVWLGGHAKRSEAARLKRKVVAIEHQRNVQERQKEEAMSRAGSSGSGQLVVSGGAAG